MAPSTSIRVGPAPPARRMACRTGRKHPLRNQPIPFPSPTNTPPEQDLKTRWKYTSPPRIRRFGELVAWLFGDNYHNLSTPPQPAPPPPSPPIPLQQSLLIRRIGNLPSTPSGPLGYFVVLVIWLVCCHNCDIYSCVSILFSLTMKQCIIWLNPPP